MRRPLFLPFSFLPILVAVILPLSACDSADDTSGENGEVDIPKRTVLYEIFGTYRTCAIEYTNLDGNQVLAEEPLDWADSVEVNVTTEFLARVTATCADLERDGKATMRLWMDGLLLETEDLFGYGASGTVQRLLPASG